MANRTKSYKYATLYSYCYALNHFAQHFVSSSFRPPPSSNTNHPALSLIHTNNKKDSTSIFGKEGKKVCLLLRLKMRKTQRVLLGIPQLAKRLGSWWPADKRRTHTDTQSVVEFKWVSRINFINISIIIFACHFAANIAT